MITTISEHDNDARNFIMSHELFAKTPNRGATKKDNIPYFLHDLTSGALHNYAETFVLYHKGVLCGQGHNGEELLHNGQQYYGYSNLACFRVSGNNQVVRSPREKSLEVLLQVTGDF
jgi:hypothetical protein